MHVLAFVDPTGPPSKTALALGLAASAQRAGCGPVAFIDTDLRSGPTRCPSAPPVEGVTLLASEPTQVPFHLNRLRREGFAVVTVDAPASLSRETEAALAPATLAIIPVDPNEDGLHNVPATVDLVDECGKPFVFVINGAATGEEIDPAVAMALVQYGPLSPIVVPRHVEAEKSRSSGGNGRGGAGIGVEEAMARLWAYIEGRLRKATDPQVRGAMLAAVSQERREFPRWELDWNATLVSGSGRRDCTVVDISGGGIAIQVAEPPEEGRSVTIETPVLGPLTAIVMRVSSDRVGLKFVLDTAEKWRLAQQLASLSQQERKRSAGDATDAPNAAPISTQSETTELIPEAQVAAGVETMPDLAAASGTAEAGSSRFHPLALLFPTIGTDELNELAADIKANGLREPITVMPEPDGRILDGRHRYLACERAGVAPRFRTFVGEDPVAYVISANLRRRHLKESQRAMIAARLANLEEGRPRATAQDYAVSQGQAAEMLGVSRRSVQSAKVVRDHGAPELVEAVEQGHVSVNVASHVAKRPHGEQSRLVKAGPQQMRVAAKKNRPPSRQEGGPSQEGTAPTDLTTGRAQWLALKVPLWQLATLDLTPEAAVAAVPPQERADISQKLVAITEWLSRLASLLRQIEQTELQHPSHHSPTGSSD